MGLFGLPQPSVSCGWLALNAERYISALNPETLFLAELKLCPLISESESWDSPYMSVSPITVRSIGTSCKHQKMS